MRKEILAAGAVLWRPSDAGVEIALIHRPRYDDWSLPKGKLEARESMAAAAVREIREETGIAARLGPWLRDVRYTVADGPKLVRYWGAQVCSAAPSSGALSSAAPSSGALSSGALSSAAPSSAAEFTPNDEVDELRWVGADVAAKLLSYAHDVDVLQRLVELGPPTSLLLLVRHAKAGRRDGWDGEDRLRPLSGAGEKQARALAGLLPLFGPDRVATAPPVRCRDTVAPLAEALGLPIVDEPLLGEDLYGDDPDATLQRVRELAALPGVTVMSSQGGVIPDAVALLARDAAVPVAVNPHRVPSKKASVWVLGTRDGALVSADYVERPGS